MPEELFVIVVLSIVSMTVLSIVKMVLRYRREREQLRRGASEGVPLSELEAVVRRAVAGAIAPLAERIEQLEPVRRLPPAGVEGEVSGADVPEGPHEAPVRPVR
ncbi:hypothetical protein GQ464_001780 [Rhodocaloribacter litoris]|uniref:hypothetical protein n=1 Tax=Rhodocaloribacter litoris TaxID=2558931 RepID=UPI00141EB866|nr:hypothetical protein [Rhodocaloribacter litoris]QXD15699.1 hypothetical protein GQ464_001780 [Rhodocaloribacter litoris]